MQGSMASTSIAFLLGVLALAWSRELPDTLWLQFLPLVLLLALMNPRVRAWRKTFYPEIKDWQPYKLAQNPMPR